MPQATITLLGCGELGTSILIGLLQRLCGPSSADDHDLNLANLIHHRHRLQGQSSVDEIIDRESAQSRNSIHLVACVRSQASAARITSDVKQKLVELGISDSLESLVSILTNQNIAGAMAADIVILGCKPYASSEVLARQGMKEALRGKILISLLGGVTVEDLQDILFSKVTERRETFYAERGIGGGPEETKVEDLCTIIRVMPNVATRVCGSMTIVQPTDSAEVTAIAVSLFSCVGKVRFLPAEMFDAGAALCASGPAFIATLLQGFVDATVGMGIKPGEAAGMVCQTVTGTVSLLEAMGAESLIDRVATKGGATAKGLDVLKEAKTAKTLSEALTETCVAMSGLSSAHGK